MQLHPSNKLSTNMSLSASLVFHWALKRPFRWARYIHDQICHLVCKFTPPKWKHVWTRQMNHQKSDCTDWINVHYGFNQYYLPHALENNPLQKKRTYVGNFCVRIICVWKLRSLIYRLRVINNVLTQFKILQAKTGWKIYDAIKTV